MKLFALFQKALGESLFFTVDTSQPQDEPSTKKSPLVRLDIKNKPPSVLFLKDGPRIL